MGEKLANAPVFLTAAQVRHNPILALDEYANGLQEQFRKIGFSDYKVRVQSEFEIDVSKPSGLSVRTHESRQHSFLNREGTACFVLDSLRLYYQVTQYDVFDTFRDEFVRGLKLLHKTVSLDYIESIGMRLLDAIVPDEDEELSAYLVKELLGIGEVVSHPSWEITHAATEAKIIAGEHRVVVRTLARHGKLAAPPDLNIEGMRLIPPFSKIEGVHAVLDSDCVFESRQSFDLSDISTRLRLLKDDLHTTFRAAVTPHALDRWS